MLGIIKGFYPPFYKKIAKQSFAKSFGFLVVFVIIVSAIVSYKNAMSLKSMFPQINRWVGQNLGNIVSDLPPIEIQNGSLTLPKQTYVKEWKDEFAFIVDPYTENMYSRLERHDNVLLLTKDKLIIKSTESDIKESEINTYSLKDVKFLKVVPTETGLKVTLEQRDFNVTPTTIKNVLEKSHLFFFPIALFWFCFMYGLGKLLHLFMFSLVSLIIKASLKAPLSYTHLLNIGVYALVPPTVAAVALHASGIVIPFFPLIYITIYVTYLFSGINASKEA
ncbi:MAG: DUF1189 family protein [Candidatus Omnitrophota bacterium]|nr:MAG: DUF1189 family protein [Candidatus Omnitrophota bacterium]